MPGVTNTPTFSPDGKQVAFFWNDPVSRPGPGIYVKTIGSETVVPVVTDKDTNGEFSYSPAWSPAVRWRAGPVPGCAAVV